MTAHSQVLHGEMYVELLKPLPPSATLYTDVEVVEVLDKGSGAVFVQDSKLYMIIDFLVASISLVTICTYYIILLFLGSILEGRSTCKFCCCVFGTREAQ